MGSSYRLQLLGSSYRYGTGAGFNVSVAVTGYNVSVTVKRYNVSVAVRGYSVSVTVMVQVTMSQFRLQDLGS